MVGKAVGFAVWLVVILVVVICSIPLDKNVFFVMYGGFYLHDFSPYNSAFFGFGNTMTPVGWKFPLVSFWTCPEGRRPETG